MTHDDQRDSEQDVNETFIRCQMVDMPDTYLKIGSYPTLFSWHHHFYNSSFLLDSVYLRFTFHLRTVNQPWYLERRDWADQFSVHKLY